MGSRRHKRSDGGDEWVRTFEVKRSIPQKQPADGHTVYQVTSVLYPRGFPEAFTKITVHKRFSEFQKLHAALLLIHKGLYLKGTFPVLPKASYFKRFDDEVVEDRLRRILELLQFSAIHPQLFNSQVFTSFFAREELDCEEVSESSEVAAAAAAAADAVDRTPNAEAIVQLQKSGNYMDAAALTLQLAQDDTPILVPSGGGGGGGDKSAAAKEVATKESSPTSPGEEMTNLPDYLTSAAEDVSRAVQHEIDEAFEESIDCYRSAIGTLLSSVQQDRCLKRQASVKRRIAQYITKAECLVVEQQKKEGVGPEAAAAAAAAAEASMEGMMPHLDLLGDVKDLMRYKVTDVISRKVQLGRDFKTGGQQQQVVIKAVHKSTVVFKTSRRSLLPIGVPHMVRLLRYYETDDSLFLILEYLPNGEIYDVVGNIFDEGPESPEEVAASDSCDGGGKNLGPGKNEMSKSQISRTVSPFNASSSVIKASPSFVQLLSREDNVVVDKDDSGDMDFVHQCLGDDTNLLCVNRDGIEKIRCSTTDNEEEEEEEEEDDEAFDFVSDLADEEGEEVTESSSVCLAAAETPSVEKADNRLHSYLGRGGPMDPMPSPFKRPRSRHAARTPSPYKAENPARSIPIFNGYNFQPGQPLPTSILRTWASQLCTVLFSLHSRGLIIRDLSPRNLLLDSEGRLQITYQFEWHSIERNPDPFAVQCLYTAPEVMDVQPLTPSCDFWSLGVVLYELATGKYFVETYPSGIRLHAPVEFHDGVCPDLASLISRFLHPLPEQRLGAGSSGRSNIQSHPFFRGLKWATEMW